MTLLCFYKHFLVETIYILYMSDSNLYPYPYTERGKIDDFSPFFQIKSPCIGQFWCFKVGAALLQTLRYNKQVWFRNHGAIGIWYTP